MTGLGAAPVPCGVVLAMTGAIFREQSGEALVVGSGEVVKARREVWVGLFFPST